MNALQSQLAAAEALIRAQPITTASVALGAALLPILMLAYQDYRHYVSMGPHGLPDNFSGWYRQLRMRSAAQPLASTVVPAPYDLASAARATGPYADQSFLATAAALEPRRGARPRVCHFVAPQRQESQVAAREMKDRMGGFLDGLVAANAAVFRRGLSRLEGPVPAVQLRRGDDGAEGGFPASHRVTRGELIHVHPPDGSTHLVLSLVDSAEVIRKGWGQRHRLSGGMLGWGYTLVYAPRDEGELEAWKGIVMAAARFAAKEAVVEEVNLP
ncbi:hypothetical protein F5Y15DRAFT_24210 [Xylariaceae sp. FL0016]|nr:hypothetical protein F5Y15DRAFT_24210 [Xylariaceae sp. FL0016]